jgi:hypothetical protein
MSFDKSLICRDCGASFVFSAGEQDFYDRKGFTSEPSRCRACRGTNAHERHASYGGRGDAAEPTPRAQELFAAVCSQCGQPARVPAIVVLSDGPRYCAECAASRQVQLAASTGGWRETW